MKYLMLILCLCSLCLFIVFSFLVPDINFNVYFPLINQKYSFNLSQYLLIIWILGLSSGLFFSMFYILKRQKLVSDYKRQYEKMSVNKDEDGTKIKALESKVKTLEIALEKALRKDTNG